MGNGSAAVRSKSPGRCWRGSWRGNGGVGGVALLVAMTSDVGRSILSLE